jgi:hypothetical protein
VEVARFLEGLDVQQATLRVNGLDVPDDVGELSC